MEIRRSLLGAAGLMGALTALGVPGRSQPRPAAPPKAPEAVRAVLDRAAREQPEIPALLERARAAATREATGGPSSWPRTRSPRITAQEASASVAGVGALEADLTLGAKLDQSSGRHI